MNTLLSKVRLSPTFDCNIRMAFESDIIKSYTIKTATLILLSKVGLICTFEGIHNLKYFLARIT